MEEPLLMLLLFFAAMLGGIADSFGGGGGLLTLPAMLAIGIPPHVALGTNMSIGVLGSWGTLNYIRQGTVIWKIALPVLIFAVIGAYVGAQGALYIPEDIFGKVFAILLPVIALILFRRGKAKIPIENETIDTKKSRPVIREAIVGFITGFHDAIFPPGAGIVKVLLIRKVLDLKYLEAIPISRCIALVKSVIALIIFAFAGKVFWHVGILMGIGYGIGSYGGSHFAINSSETFIRRILFVLVICLCSYLAYKFLL